MAESEGSLGHRWGECEWEGGGSSGSEMSWITPPSFYGHYLPNSPKLGGEDQVEEGEAQRGK